MIRVAYNARMFSGGDLRGIGRYFKNLLQALPAAGVQPVLCSNAPLNEPIRAELTAQGCEVMIGGPAHPLVWDQRWDRMARQAGAQVMHAPGNYGLPLFSKLPAVLTLHDAIDYAFYSDRVHPAWRQFTKRQIISRWMHWSARTGADHVITDSEDAKRIIHRRLRVPNQRISVIHAAADTCFQPSDPTEVRETLNLADDYFFYYGGWETRKNVGFLLRAFAAADLGRVRLVLAGGSGGEADALKEDAARRGIMERTVWLGRISDGQLRALLSGALAFVYPSRAEGFGLQLCEAMACRCPVLAARASCLPEVLGDGGETFSLNDPAELAAQMRRLAAEPVWRESQAERAARRGLDFDWNRAAEQTAVIYHSLLN